METIYIKSKRNSLIPTTIKCSNSCGGLIMLIHGFKSERSEDKRFDLIEDELSKYGAYSIAMDFPGCNESKESTMEYSLNNCLDDMESCYQYMISNYEIDTNNVSLVGYSLGGRLIAIFASRHPEIKNLVFWAATCHNGFEEGRFIDQEIAPLKLEAQEKGYCTFYDIFGDRYFPLPKSFLDEMESINIEECLQQFKGNALIIQGNKDITINPNNGQLIDDNLVSAASKQLLIMDGTNHGFGIWDGRLQDSIFLTDKTIEFLKNNL